VKTAFLFPGQGSAFPGMGRELCREWPEARQVDRRVSRLADVDLEELSCNRSRDEITAAANVHLVTLVHSLATARVLRSAGIRPDLVAGHSLGHFSALVAADALDLTEGVAVVKLRGELLESCCRDRPGRMVAIRGVSAQSIERVLGAARQGSALCIANVNGRDEIVISGATDAIGRACRLLRAQRTACRMLPVTGAFHSPLVAEAAVGLADRLENLDLRTPACPVVSTRSGELLSSARQIAQDLRSHMERPVRWDAVLETLTSGAVSRWIEVGPGKVLTGLTLRWERSAQAFSTTDGRALGRLLDRAGAHR
jgi:[acyl-carrier-protein] S-malonyltransferase